MPYVVNDYYNQALILFAFMILTAKATNETSVQCDTHNSIPLNQHQTTLTGVAVLSALLGVVVMACLDCLCKDIQKEVEKQKQITIAKPPESPDPNSTEQTSTEKVAKIPVTQPTTNFALVMGYEKILKRLNEVIVLHKIKNNNHLANIPSPRVILFSGPPGNGKTFLANAFAGETKRNLIILDGATCITSFMGSGPQKITQTFEAARSHSPSVIFIDEIDSIIRERSHNKAGGAEQEYNKCVISILQELDKIKNDPTCDVIVIAATNHEHVLDSAFLSRCRVKITLDNPNATEREKILAQLITQYKCHSDVSLKRLVEQTYDFSVRDIEGIFTDGVMMMITPESTDNPILTAEILEEAIDRKRLGEARPEYAKDKNKKWETARHEAGHALVHYYAPNNTKLNKITILPRDKSLGVNIFLPNDENPNLTKTELLNSIAIMMGGMAAETLDNAEKMSIGVMDDFARANDYARKMASIGMYQGKNQPTFYSLDSADVQQMSDQRKQELEKRVDEIFESAAQKARTIMLEHRKELDSLTSKLFEKETLTHEEIIEIIQSTSPVINSIKLG